MAKPQRPGSGRPHRTFVPSNAEVDPRGFAEVAWEARSSSPGPTSPLRMWSPLTPCRTYPLEDRDISAGLVGEVKHESWGYGPGEREEEWPVSRGPGAGGFVA